MSNKDAVPEDYLEPGDRLGDYEIGPRLGAGSFGHVFSVQSSNDATSPLVVKIAETTNTHRCTKLLNEYNILMKYNRCILELGDHLKNKNHNTVFLPKVYMCAEMQRIKKKDSSSNNSKTAQTKSYSVMILQRLEQSLAEVPSGIWLGEYENVCHLGRIMTNGLRFLHLNISVIHNDIKPANIMLSQMQSKNSYKLVNNQQFYMIDFGLATKLRLRESAPRTGSFSFAGSTPWCSSKSHEREYEPNTFDDIESLLYVLTILYLSESTVPWVTTAKLLTRDKKMTRSEKIDKIGESKRSTALATCGRVNPKWRTLLEYIWKNCRTSNLIDYEFVLECFQ